MKKNKGTGKKKETAKGQELNETFNNPALVTSNLCYAAQSVWSVYDAVSTMASKNRQILTRGERKTISEVDAALLNCFVELDELASKRLEHLAEKKEGGEK